MRRIFTALAALGIASASYAYAPPAEFKQDSMSCKGAEKCGIIHIKPEDREKFLLKNGLKKKTSKKTFVDSDVVFEVETFDSEGFTNDPVMVKSLHHTVIYNNTDKMMAVRVLYHIDSEKIGLEAYWGTWVYIYPFSHADDLAYPYVVVTLKNGDYEYFSRTEVEMITYIAKSEVHKGNIYITSHPNE